MSIYDLTKQDTGLSRKAVDKEIDRLALALFMSDPQSAKNSIGAILNDVYKKLDAIAADYESTKSHYLAHLDGLNREAQEKREVDF